MTEKLELTAYPDPVNADGLPVTNGYGSTQNMNNELWTVGDLCTESEARWMLRRDVEAAYWPCKTIPFWNQMDAFQRAALADLNYNEGYTYKDGDHDSLDNALQVRMWLRIGEILQLYDNNDRLGLSRRRYAEWLLWQGRSPQEAYDTAWSKNTVEDIMEAVQ